MGYNKQQQIEKRPGQSSKTPKAPAARFNDAVFIKRELTADEQRACKAQAFDDAECVDQLVKLCSKGYKLTFRWDEYTNSFAVWASVSDKDHHNFGYILTGRGSLPSKAFKQLLFKHYNLCNEESWQELQGDAYDPLDD